MKTRLLLCLLLAGSFFNAFAQPGTFDLTFNGTGIHERTFYKNLSNEDITASLLQPDGKLLVAGYQSLSYNEGFVARFLANGQLDNTFGQKGVYLSGNILDQFIPNAIALQNDGKIVLAGQSINGGNTQACLVRLNAEGTIDNTYNGVGYRGYGPTPYNSNFTTVQIHPTTQNIIAAGTSAANSSVGDYFLASTNPVGWDAFFPYDLPVGSFNDQAFASVLVNDNLMYVAGISYDGTSRPHFSIMALNPNDGTQVSFGSAVLNSSVANADDICSAMQVASDGKIVLAGTSTNGASIRSMVYRLLSDGTTDSGFGSGGVRTYDFSSTTEKVSTLVLDPDNKIVLGGYSFQATDLRWTLTRLNTDGSVDPDFGTRIYAGTGTHNAGRGIGGLVRLSTGKYLLAGEVFNASGKRDGLWKRVNANGSPDTTIPEIPFWVSDANSVFYDMAVRPDGKIWVCGNMESSAVYPDQQAFIARFNAQGTLDATLGNSSNTEAGIKTIQASPQSSAAYAMELLPDGKVLVAGSTTVASLGKDFFVTRLNPDGSPDLTFNAASATPGRFTLDFFGEDDEACDIALQSDGKILVYGYATNNSFVPSRNTYVLIRLNADGTFDTGFRPSSAPYNMYVYNNSDTDNLFMKVKVQQDDKIVFVGSDGLNFATNDFFVVRLRSNGEDDPTFNNSTGIFTYDFNGGEDAGLALCIKPSGDILVGGLTLSGGNKRYGMIQVRPDGTRDLSFGLSGGRVIHTLGGTIEAFTDIVMENNLIVATGLGGSPYNFSITMHRFYANGLIDNTFSAGGAVALTPGMSYASAISGNRIFVVGSRNTRDAPVYGVLTKVKLGAGIPTLTTTMVYNNVNKTYGDEPFIMKPISNSPAPITYQITAGTCAEVNPTTGLVRITCAGPNNTVTIRATQAAVPGYTNATADAVINIAKATPKIRFKNQGALVGETISLQVETDAEETPVFVQLNGESFVTVESDGSATMLDVGSATVSVSYGLSDNFLPANAVAEIYAYTSPVKPKAGDDVIELVFGIETLAIVDVLANDTGYTGTIVPALTDLDPETPGIQRSFVSPALGGFLLNDDNVLEYSPFHGFIGSGEIFYTVRDNRGDVSLPAKITVSVKSPQEIPALKATELFTPNGDGLNDAFVIGYVDPDKPNRLKVFDRNGGEVYSASDYKNDWSGELTNGKILENGVYYFLFVEGNADDQRELKGVVEIRR